MSAERPQVPPMVMPKSADWRAAPVLPDIEAGEWRIRVLHGPTFVSCLALRDHLLAAVRAYDTHAALVRALEDVLERYVQMIQSGDCGFWNPEEEPHVITARAALAAARKQQP